MLRNDDTSTIVAQIVAVSMSYAMGGFANVIQLLWGPTYRFTRELSHRERYSSIYYVSLQHRYTKRFWKFNKYSLISYAHQCSFYCLNILKSSADNISTKLHPKSHFWRKSRPRDVIGRLSSAFRLLGTYISVLPAAFSINNFCFKLS